MTPDDPTVFVVDDDPAVRDSLKWLIESAGFVVETYDCAAAFLAAYRPSQPGCILLDVRMPGMSGIELQEKLAAEEISAPVIIITGHGDVPMAVRAMMTGAVDLLEKPFDDDVLLKCIRDAVAQDARNRSEWVQRSEIAACVALLTPRENEVMQMVVAGKSNKQMAGELKISPKTIEAHRGHVMHKMQADSLAELVQMIQMFKRRDGRATTARGGKTPI